MKSSWDIPVRIDHATIDQNLNLIQYMKDQGYLIMTEQHITRITFTPVSL